MEYMSASGTPEEGLPAAAALPAGDDKDVQSLLGELSKLDPSKIIEGVTGKEPLLPQHCDYLDISLSLSRCHHQMADVFQNSFF
jgi:hypothetical protein